MRSTPKFVNNHDICILKIKSQFIWIHLGKQLALISDNVDLSQAPVKAARPRTRASVLHGAPVYSQLNASA